MIAIGTFEFTIKGYNRTLKKTAFVKAIKTSINHEEFTIRRPVNIWNKLSIQEFDESIKDIYSTYKDSIFNKEVCDIGYVLTVIMDGLILSYRYNGSSFILTTKVNMSNNSMIFHEANINDLHYSWGLRQSDVYIADDYIIDEHNINTLFDLLSIDESIFDPLERIYSWYYCRSDGKDISEYIDEKNSTTYIIVNENKYIRIDYDVLSNRVGFRSYSAF